VSQSGVSDCDTYLTASVGNRLTETTGGGTKTYTYNQANRLTAAGADTYGYDVKGNQTSATVGGVTTTYTFDALDRMTAIGGAVSASYGYNGLGLRVSATVGGVTTSTAWDLAADPPQQLVEGNIEFVRGLGNELIAEVPLGGGATTVAADALGSPRLVTDSAGTVIGTTQYDAFGAVQQQSGTQAQVGFTGTQQDAASGLVYLRARYYDPRTGRFLTKDPVRGSAARPATQHAYTYALNNPTRFIDPSGKRCVAVSYGGIFDNPFGSGGGGGGGGCGMPVRGPVAGGIGAGVAIAFAAAMGSGEIRQKLDGIKQQLDDATIDAARREANGEVVAINPGTGRPYDHQHKVGQALQGLNNLIDHIAAGLADSRTSPAEREALLQLYEEIVALIQAVIEGLTAGESADPMWERGLE
jgi:RHS repeat-associated protein